ANVFANAAEEYTERGQLDKAIEAHFRAAASGKSNHPQATAYSHSGSYAQNMPRHHGPTSLHRVAIGRNSPIPSGVAATLPTSSSGVWEPNTTKSVGGVQYPQTSGFMSSDEDPSSSMYGSRNFFVGQTGTESSLGLHGKSNAGKGRHHDGATMSDHQSPATVPVVSLDASVNSGNSLYNSIDNSYLVLGEKNNGVQQDDEPEDPFNKFWEVVENLVQKISGPVAFTTAPLNTTGKPSSSELRDEPAEGPGAQQSTIPIPRMASLPSSTGGPTLSTAPGRLNFANRMGIGGVLGRGASATYAKMDSLRDIQPPPNMSDTLRTNNLLNSYFIVNDGMGASSMSMMGGSGSGHSDGEGAARLSSLRDTGGGGGVVTHHHTLAEDDGVSPFGVESSSFGKGRRPLSLPAALPMADKGFVELGSGKPRPRTVEELTVENEHLKEAVDYLTKKVASLEKAAEENNMLKSSIIQFRQDFAKQAKRFGMGGSLGHHPHNRLEGTNSSSSLIIPPSQMNQRRVSTGPHAPSGVTSPTSASMPSVASNPEIQNQVEFWKAKANSRDAEMKKMKESYEAQVAELTKYKERWMKLKESAKKKKEAKAGGPASSTGTNDVSGIDADAVSHASIGSGFSAVSNTISQGGGGNGGRNSPYPSGYNSDASNTGSLPRDPHRNSTSRRPEPSSGVLNEEALLDALSEMKMDSSILRSSHPTTGGPSSHAQASAARNSNGTPSSTGSSAIATPRGGGMSASSSRNSLSNVSLQSTGPISGSPIDHQSHQPLAQSHVTVGPAGVPMPRSFSGSSASTVNNNHANPLTTSRILPQSSSTSTNPSLVSPTSPRLSSPTMAGSRSGLMQLGMSGYGSGSGTATTATPHIVTRQKRNSGLSVSSSSMGGGGNGGGGSGQRTPMTGGSEGDGGGGLTHTDASILGLNSMYSVNGSNLFYSATSNDFFDP
ncbi:hypothetical protein HDV05_007710, partial [Chytridiales sp. JEL 0842]